jgi:hypothetical protein
MVEFCNGRAYLAEYIPQAGLSVVWISQPLAYTVFDQASDFWLLPGELAIMAKVNDESMVFATDQRVWNLTTDGRLVELANYGAVPGDAFDSTADSTLYFWTQRGICKAMPFTNLTEANASMPPGVRATGCIAMRNGMQQMIVFTAGGGTPFNARTERALA